MEFERLRRRSRRPNRRRTRGWVPILWSVFLLNLGIGLLLSAGGGGKETVLGYARMFLRGEAWTDSWHPMIAAVEHLRASPDVPVYSRVFSAAGIKFQYPPSSLLLLDLVQRGTGASWETLVRGLNALSWWCVLLIGAASGKLLLAASEAPAPTPGFPAPGRLRVFMPCLAITLLFYPLTRSFYLGQIQTSLTLLAALTLLSWQSGRKRSAGVLLGLCCAVKPQWALVIVWGVLRRQWGMAAGCLLTLGGLTLAAIGLYGWRHYPDYLAVLSFLSRHGEGYFPNQSVNGLLNRFLFNGNNLTWVGNAFPPFNPAVYLGSLVWALLLLGTTLWWRRKRASTRDLALFMLALTMASPIAWEHHYGLLLPVFALLAPACRSAEPPGRFFAPSLLLAFVLVSQRLEVTDLLAHSRLNVLQSYLFFGALTVLALLWRLLHLARDTAAPGPAPGSPAAREP